MKAIFIGETYFHPDAVIGLSLYLDTEYLKELGNYDEG